MPAHGAMTGSLPADCHRAGTCRGNAGWTIRSRWRTWCAHRRAWARRSRPGSFPRRECAAWSRVWAVRSCCSILPAYLFLVGALENRRFRGPVALVVWLVVQLWRDSGRDMVREGFRFAQPRRGWRVMGWRGRAQRPWCRSPLCFVKLL